MNKFRISFLIIALTIIFIPFLSSCLDDKNETPLLAIGTIKVLEEEYYFLLDNGETIYPGDVRTLHYDDIQDGKRVIVYFYKLYDNNTGYDYNGKILHIEDILTKDIISLTPENADSIGNDLINITSVWFAGNCLNIEFQLKGTRYPNQKHMVNLVRNKTQSEDPMVDDSGYLILELRHNAYNDSPAYDQDGIAAFREPYLEEENMDIIGISIRYNSLFDGIKYEKIDFETKKNNTRSYRGHHTDYSEIN